MELSPTFLGNRDLTKVKPINKRKLWNFFNFVAHKNADSVWSPKIILITVVRPKNGAMPAFLRWVILRQPKGLSI